jgi:hypothetical protein
MLFLSNEPPARLLAVLSCRGASTAMVMQALVLAGCASPAFERTSAASDDERRIDAATCSTHHEPLTGLLGESMLLGMTFGGGRAVIESENAANRKAYKKCMDARQAKPVT